MLGVDALGELAGERLRVREQLVERAPGHLALVEREDGVAALVGSAHRPKPTRQRRGNLWR